MKLNVRHLVALSVCVSTSISIISEFNIDPLKLELIPWLFTIGLCSVIVASASSRYWIKPVLPAIWVICTCLAGLKWWITSSLLLTCAEKAVIVGGITLLVLSYNCKPASAAKK